MKRIKRTLQGTALLLVVPCGLTGMVSCGHQFALDPEEAALDICLNSEREPVVRVEACRTAAEQGDASARFSLGVMYFDGEGVPENNDEAVTWYRLAAEQGYAPAQDNLGRMYGRGEGVPRDLGEAVKWTPSCAKTRPFRNRPQISSLDALGIRAESRVFRAAGLTSDPWAGG